MARNVLAGAPRWYLELQKELGRLELRKKGLPFFQWKGKAEVEEEGCLSDFCKCLFCSMVPGGCARQELLLGRQVGGRSILGKCKWSKADSWGKVHSQDIN